MNYIIWNIFVQIHDKLKFEYLLKWNIHLILLESNNCEFEHNSCKRKSIESSFYAPMTTRLAFGSPSPVVRSTNDGSALLEWHWVQNFIYLDTFFNSFAWMFFYSFLNCELVFTIKPAFIEWLFLVNARIEK